MRRPHRSIETFDISLMAVVTKAMGAFLVLMLLLLPYYTPNKQTEEDIKEIVLQLKKARESIETVSRQLGPAGGGGGAQANLQEAKTQVELAAQVVGKMRALLDKALASVARLEQENNRLAAENDRLTGELRKAEQEIAELKEEIDRLRNKLEQGDRLILASVSVEGCDDVLIRGVILREGSENDYTWTKDKSPILPQHLLYLNLGNGGEVSRYYPKDAVKLADQGPVKNFGYMRNRFLVSYSTGQAGKLMLAVMSKEDGERYRFRGEDWRALTPTPRACTVSFDMTAKVAGAWHSLRPRTARIDEGTVGAVLAGITSDEKGISFRPASPSEVQWYGKLVALSLSEQRKTVKDLPDKERAKEGDSSGTGKKP